MTDHTQDADEIKVAVVIGGHPYDVPGFRAMLDRVPHTQTYIQDLDSWAFDWGQIWDRYDVHLFYTMHTAGKLSVRNDADDRILAALDRLGETRQGVLVLHHALLGFPESPTWSALCGIQDRKIESWHAGEQVRTEIAQPDHPITRGLQSWTMTDEVYRMNEPGADSEVLLTTDHPRSMSRLGWARQHKNARVFCYQSGHDNLNYSDPNFQTILQRAIQWLAHRI